MPLQPCAHSCLVSFDGVWPGQSERCRPHCTPACAARSSSEVPPVLGTCASCSGRVYALGCNEPCLLRAVAAAHEAASKLATIMPVLRRGSCLKSYAELASVPAEGTGDFCWGGQTNADLKVAGEFVLVLHAMTRHRQGQRRRRGQRRRTSFSELRGPTRLLY